jgi:pyruvate,water dikinase
VIASAQAIQLADAGEERQFGGKAAGLAAAVRAGLPVPDGMALNVEFVTAVAAREPQALEAAAEIRAAIDGPLAVRSSCVGEDSATASFAGQHQTKLGVRTAAQLVDAITEVWRSGRTDAALAYREKLGLDPEPRMAVIVQALVESDVAGVMFTRNPVTGADEFVIEATWGLGEAVVQGLVTPDTYRLSRNGDVLQRVVGHKDRAVRARPDGSTALEPIVADLADRSCLDDSHLQLLSSLAYRCEANFDAPSDIEWALKGARAYILQRRAITGRPK